MHHWDKAVARSLYWKDNVQFDTAGRCLVPGNEVAASDPYLAMMRTNIAATASASGSVKVPMRARVTSAATIVMKRVVSPIVRYGSVLSVGMMIGYLFY